MPGIKQIFLAVSTPCNTLPGTGHEKYSLPQPESTMQRSPLGGFVSVINTLRWNSANYDPVTFISSPLIVFSSRCSSGERVVWFLLGE